MAEDSWKLKKSLNIEPRTSPTLDSSGDIGVNSSDNELKVYLDGSTRGVVTKDQTQTLTNKTLTTPVISSISNTGTLTLPTSTDTLVGRATTDTLTNKTLTAPTIDVATFDGQASAPSNPSAGNYKVYVDDTTSKLQILDSSGTVTTVGTSAGGIDYITNGDAESATTGWARYDDGSAAAPVDGTGGSPNADFTFDRSTSSPLRGLASFLLTKTANDRRGHGVSYNHAIDSADQGKVMQITFDYAIASGTYATGDLAVYVIHDPNGTPKIIQPSGYQIENVGVNSVARLTFQTEVSAQLDYTLCFHVASTSASAYTVKLDNVQLGPQVVPLGAPVTDWVSYTPTTAGLGTPTSVNFKWRRVGDSVEIQGRLAVGTTTGVAATISLPSGLVADSNKISTGGEICGSVVIDSTVTAVDWYLYGTGNSSNLNIGIKTSTTTSGFAYSNGNAITNSSGNVISLQGSVPIVGWSSSTVVSSSADTRVVAWAGKHATAGSIGTSLTAISYATESIDTHNAYNTSTGIFTAPIPGAYKVSGTLHFAGASWTVGVVYDYRILIDGSSQVISQGQVARTATQELPALTVEHTFQLNAGQTIQFAAFQNETAAGRLLGGAAYNYASINLIQGPSQIAASEVIAARYLATGTGPFSSETTLVYPSKDFDTHGCYNNATGVFTARAPGYYSFQAGLLSNSHLSSTTGAIQIGFRKNGGSFNRIGWTVGNGATTNFHVSGGDSVYLNAGDTFEIRAISTATITAANGYLSIHRLGGVM